MAGCDGEIKATQQVEASSLVVTAAHKLCLQQCLSDSGIAYTSCQLQERHDEQVDIDREHDGGGIDSC